jgi:hypothetical protein
MDAKVIENERTAMAQKTTRQPDGPGKRIGKKEKFPSSANLPPAEQNCSASAYRRSKRRRHIGRAELAPCTTSARR